MSAATALVATPELVEARARFTELSREWNLVNEALALAADELKACGQMIAQLERHACPDAMADYGAES